MTPAADPICVFLIPGDWDTPTGGYTYDRRIVLAWREAGHRVDVLRLDGAWPHPTEADRAAAAAALDRLPDGTRVVADGLAFGVLGDVVAPHAHRLQWVALVHHPLHMESGLGADEQRYLREAESRALRAARGVIVTSPATARDVQALGMAAERIRVIEPGTDPVAQSLRASPHAGPLRLLCVATLTPRKGHAVLLEALSGLTHLPWTLDGVGSDTRDPVTAQRLYALAEPLGPRVVWHGELDAAALGARYAAADVLVLASLHEGFGMVVTEALAHGLPVVATRAGALADTVPADAGLLVPPGDAAALRKALAQVLTDHSLRERLAASARAAAARLPTWDVQARRFLIALQELT